MRRVGASEPPGTRADSREEDLELARLCVSGDEHAQRSFVDRFSPLVFSLCARSGLPSHEAEDVCQDVFLDVFRSLPGFRGEARLSTWLYVLAHRRLADYFRSPQRRHVPSGIPGDDTFPDAPWALVLETAATQSAQSPDGRRLTEALARLGEPERAILLAYYLGEMSVAEIARVFRLPTGTVKTHLHRGRLALRKELKP